MTHADVIIVGAGPAGIAAALAAAEHGCTVLVLDENPAPGGQIWRDGVPGSVGRPHDSPQKKKALADLGRSGARVLQAHRVFDVDAHGVLFALREDMPHPQAFRFTFDRLTLATGARERFLPFPGWPLPGVFGAGGLQALAQSGLPVDGKRVVVAGTGPLLLAVAAHLREHGAHIPCIAEQASASSLARFIPALAKYPGKLGQGLAYRAALWKTRFRTNCWPVQANPNKDETALRSVVLCNGSKTWEEPCDLLACGFHLIPNTELAALLGCALDGGFVRVDARQRTSLENIYCAGEPTGIAGLEAALLEGRIAGLACAGQPTGSLERKVALARGFSRYLERTFALRAELCSLASPETLVCRCEDVPFATLSGFQSWREAKLQTRCGMGPCQGRVCGPIVHTLFGWESASVRPPIFPVPVDALCLSPTTVESLEEKS